MGKKSKRKQKFGGDDGASKGKFKSKPGVGVSGGGVGQGRPKKPNPFEVHTNRVKHDVVGRKSKFDRGFPGVARAKGIEARDKTLLQEYKMRHKSNVFVDRRIGENDATMDPETKIALRLAAEKKRQFGKKSLFNLNDDEELTHGGLALDDSNLNDKLSLSDDEDDQGLDSQFVRDQHFGGGFLTRRDERAEDPDKPKTKKEWIDEIIAESKRKKAESQREKEEQYEAVNKLDAELKTFMEIMSNQQITDEDKLKAKKECEFRDYDMLVKELGFERSGKAKAVDKLKTPDEVAKEQREKLVALEADRVRRMKGEDKPKRDTAMRSADDLDDGFMIGKKVMLPLSYKDGEMLQEDDEYEFEDDAAQEEDADEEEDAEEEEEDGEEEVEDEEEEEEDDEDEQIENGDDLKVDDEEEDVNETEDAEVNENEEEDTNENENEEEDENEEDEEEGDDYEDDESDKYSDILEESGSEDEGDNNDLVLKKAKEDVKEGKKNKKESKKEMIEAAKKEIPYTFEVPQDYEAFWALLEGRTPAEVQLVLERMTACHHPSLGGRNKEKCEDIFAYLLQTLNVLADVDGDSPMDGVSPMEYMDAVVRQLYTVTQLTPTAAAKALVQVIKEKYDDCSARKFKRYPMADTFIFLKVAGLLFPASDFVQPVMTPVLAFLTHLLGQARLATSRDITAALFTAFLMFEYLSLSKRFSPELANLLNGLVFLAVPAKDKTRLPLTPPFRPVGPLASLLVPDEPVNEMEPSKLSLASLNDDEAELSDDFKVNALVKAVELLRRCCELWSGHAAIRAIMQPTTTLLDHLMKGDQPACVQGAVAQLRAAIAALPPHPRPLAKAEARPKSIKMFEPNIEEVVEGVKKRFGTKSQLEEQKLVHKIKRERKAARREIEKDTQYLARLRLKETLHSDAERKRKVAQIMAGLRGQEGEYNSLKKKKKH